MMQVQDKFKCKLCKNTYAYEGTSTTHVMIAHCKINSHLCNPCEYHKTELDGIKAQTPKGAPGEAGTMRRHLKNHFGEK